MSLARNECTLDGAADGRAPMSAHTKLDEPVTDVPECRLTLMP
jgi:hypothetical protein